MGALVPFWVFRELAVNLVSGPMAILTVQTLSEDGSRTGGVIATPASDVYMLGGLMFEVLTGGFAPYHWLHAPLTAQRRRHAAGIPFRPDGFPHDVVGLKGLSVMEAARMDGHVVEWRVRSHGSSKTDTYDEGLPRLVDLMERCLERDANKRPHLEEVQSILVRML